MSREYSSEEGSLIATTMTSLATENSNRSSKNGTNFEVSQWFHVIEITLLVSLCIIILTSSLVIILAVCGCKKLHSIPGFLMIGLGVCDIFIAIGSMLPSIAAEVAGKWVFGGAICKGQVFFTTYFSSLESCFIMLCAVDKGLAIAKPLSYAQFRHIYKRLFLGMVVGIICFNLPVPLLFIVLAEKVHYLKPLAACTSKLSQSLSFLPILGYMLQFFVPGFVIIVCYVFIGYKAIQSKRANQRRQIPKSTATRSTMVPKLPTSDTSTTRRNSEASSKMLSVHSNRLNSHHSSPCHSNGNISSSANHADNTSSLSSFLQHLKMCKMLLVIAIVYFVSFLPIFIYQILVWHDLVGFNMYHYKMINIMQYFNGVIDGVVFYSMSQTFKDQVHKMFGRKRRQTVKNARSCATTMPLAARGVNRRSMGDISTYSPGPSPSTKLLPASNNNIGTTLYSDRLHVPGMNKPNENTTEL